jgi:L-ascorbate metabolism protein UlaG (beta-lactamase superfamily)
MHDFDHFDGKTYFNPYDKRKRKFLHFLLWQLTRRATPWPSHVPVVLQKARQQRVKKGELWVMYIGHSTTLIQIDGFNILTDPIWSERASPLSWIGPKRVSMPGIRFEDLPPIDFVLISHCHYDHLDLPTLKKLEERDHPQFFVAMGNQLLLKSIGIQSVRELDWWNQVELASGLSLSFVPSQHFAARTLWDVNRTLWGGYMIKSLSHFVYFAGDTGYSPFFKEIRNRLGAPTLSFIPIGAFKPLWLMQPVHLGPRDAIQAHLDLESKQSIAIHFGTFRLSDEGIDEPVVELQRELQRRQIDPNKFLILKPGEGKTIDPHLQKEHL